MTSLRKYSIVLLVVAALAGLMAAPAQAQSLALNCQTGSFPSAMVLNTPYTLNCTASGGATPYLISISSGTIPAGMSSIQAVNEFLVEGSPSVAGTYSFTVTVTDHNNTSMSQSFTVTVGGSGGTGGSSITLSSLSPSSGAAGTQQSILLLGSGFTSTCQVYFNGTVFNPTFFGSTQLSVIIPAQYVTGSNIPVYVRDYSSGASSGTIYFTISGTSGGGAVTLSSLQPSSIAAGSPGFTLYINGSGFSQGQLVTFGNLTLNSTFVTSNQIYVQVPSTALTTSQTVNVSVAGSAPLQFVIGSGSGSSGALTINCNSATPLAAGSFFSQLCTVGGGNGEYTWTTSNLPGGLTLSANTGNTITISGTPSVTQGYTINVSDSAGHTGIYNYSVGGSTGGGTYSISSVSPNSSAVGAATYISVVGAGFNSTSTIYFNGMALTTQYLGTNQLSATIPANVTTIAGTYNVFVNTPGLGYTNTVSFTVGSGGGSGISLTSISPTSVPAGSGSFLLTLIGSGFSQGVSVNFGSTSIGATVINSNEVTVTIPSYLLTTAQTVSVTVGTSNSIAFTVGTGSTGNLTISCNPVAGPTMIGVSYTQTCSVNTGTAPFTWSVISLPAGLYLNYSNTTSATITGTPSSPQSYSYTITVVDSSASHLSGSTTVTGSVSTSSYNITTLSPSTIAVGSGNTQITVLGNGFNTSSVVLFNSTQLSTQYVSANQLNATVPSSYLSSSQNASISVSTSGSGNTNALTLTIGTGGTTGGTLSLSCSPGVGPSTVNTSYSTTCTASGGSGSYNWTFPGMPAYLAYNANTGSVITITGTPNVSAPYNFTVKVSDTSSPVQTGSLQLAGETTTSTTTGGSGILLTSLSPSSAAVNSAAVTITVNGSGFSNTSYVNFNGFPVGTQFVSSNQLFATIPAGQLTFALSALVSVTTPGVGTSNSLTFVVGNGGTGAQMTIACSPGVGPSTPNAYYTGNCTVNGGTQPYTWSIAGGSLPSGLSLIPNGPLSTINGYTSLNGPYSYTLQVVDSSSPANTATLVFAGETGAGTGGTTGGFSITSLSPTSAAVGSTQTTLTVYGVGFASNAQVYFNGSALSTTYVSSGQLTAIIPAASLTAQQTASVTVNSGGVTSNALTFTVGNAPSAPISISCTPTTGPALPGSYSTTCTANGGKAPYTWTAPNLPLGLGVTNTNTNTASIVGSILVNLNYNFSIQVTDSSTPPNTATYPFIGTMPNPVAATITSMSPVSTPAGSQQFTLNVQGSGFITGVTFVQFGNFPLQTTVVSGTQLTAIVPANLVATASTGIVVQLQGTNSNSVDFYVTGTNNGVTPNSLSFTYGQGGTIPAAQTLTVTNIGGSTNFSAIASGVVNSTPWLSVTPSTGTIPGSISVIVAPAGLPIGTYSGTITLNAFNAAGSVTIPVTLYVTGAPTLSASPTSLTLSSPTGGSASQTIKVASSDGNTVFQYNAAATSNNGGNWLAVSPTSGSTPGSITVTASATNLPPSTYSGSITVTSTGGIPSQVAIPVSFQVTSQGTLTVSPTQLTFNGQAGQNPGSQTIAVSAGNNATVNYTVAASTTSGGNWLSATNSGTTPGTITVSTNISGLAGGTYNGTVVITAPGTSNSPVSVGVTLTVTSQPGLTPSPASLTFSYLTGGSAPAAQSVSIAGVNGTGTYNYNVAAATSSGGNWLSVSPTSGTTPGSVSVSVTPGNLAVGSYNGTLTITAPGAGPVTIPVTFTVSTPPTLTASPSSVSFTAQAGGNNPDPQNINVSASGNANVAYTVGVSVVGGGSWLAATASGNTPGTISVSANTGGLAAGTYQGTVTITASGVSNSPLTVPVTLTVSSAPATLSLNPSSLTFNATVNGTAPAPQSVTVSTSNGVTANYSVTATTSGGGTWLSVSPTTGTTSSSVSVSVNQTGLAIGQYTGTVSVASPGATNTPQTIQVTLNVQSTPSIVAAPGNLSFLVPADGTTPAAQSITIISTGANTAFTTAATSQGNWLTVSAGGTTPASVMVTVNPTGLLAGQTYNGVVSVSAPASNPAVLQVPVTLTLAPQGPASLGVVPSSVYLTYTQGAGADLQHVNVVNNGSGTLNFTAQAQTANCGNWLTVVNSSGTATASNPAVLGFSVNPTGVSSQTCRGSLTLNDGNGNTTNVPVYMAISSAAQSVLLSQTAMDFVATSGGTAPAPQTFQILNPGSGLMNWNISAKVLSGSSWLSVAPNSGSSQSLAQAGSPINVTVDPTGLAAGLYYGSIQVTSAGALNSPQSITVAFTVLPAGTNPSPQATPNGVIITGTSGGTSDTQTVTMSNSGANAVTFSSAVITDDGQAWLVTSPTSGSIPPGSTSSISLTANLNGLAGGLRHGTLRIAFSDGSVQTVDAQLAVAGNSAGVAGVRACGTSSLAMEFLTPAQNFQASARVAIPLQVLVKDCSGNLLTNSSTAVDVVAGTSDLRLNYTGNGIWAGTWTPPSASPSASLTARGVSSSGGTTSNGAIIAAGSVAPALAGAPPYVGAVVNAGSFLLPGLVSPGTMVSIFGSGLADGQSTVFSVPFPSTLQGAQFSLRGLPLPLFYASDGQVNAIIPTGLSADERDQLVVTRDTTLSAPADLLVADVDPGIFATNQQGTGQGAILVGGTSQVAAPVGTPNLAGAAPASAGQVVSIFLAGLGTVSNPPADGSPSTSATPSLTTVQPVVTIGGVQATVGYSGLAPGEVGLYQINVTVPAGVPAGSAVPVVVTIGNGISNTVTMAIM